MNFQRFSCTIIAGLVPMLLAGCGEVRELIRVRQLAEIREEQAVQLVKLHNELELVEEKLASVPPDRSAELAGLRQELLDKSAEEALLEAEISDVYARRRALKAEAEEFRRKYVIP